MFVLTVAAFVVSLLSLGINIYALYLIFNHFRYWDAVTDKMIAQIQASFNAHDHRIGNLELASGRVYGAFGYKTQGKV